MKELVSVDAVADYFIRQPDAESGDSMTHLRLQKLVYYAQAWHLVLRKEKLFKDNMQAWAHGPVCEKLWHRFKGFGINPIPITAASTAASELPADAKRFLDEVWRVYGQFSAKRLEELTHEETPWKRARGDKPEYASCRNIIKPEWMEEYYRAALSNAAQKA